MASEEGKPCGIFSGALYLVLAFLKLIFPNNKPRVSYGIFATILYYIYFFLDGYDAQTISVCMRAFEVSLGLSPSSAALLATVEFMATLGCCPLWGLLVDKFDANHVAGGAMFISGMACILLGNALSYPVIVFLRFLHGFALACTAPAKQKIITDSVAKDNHSTHFGFCHAANCFGRLMSAVITTYTSMTMFLGRYGWRMCYCALGYIWIFMAILVVFFMKPFESNSNSIKPCKSSNKRAFEAVEKTFEKKTSYLLLFAIYISDAPFGAFVYMISYLQYIGLSDFMAGVGCATALIGGFIGGAVGGIIIDLCHKANGEYGRLSVGTVIVASRILIVLAIFRGPIPTGGKFAWFHYVEFALLGASLLTVSSVDLPIMADIVEQKYQASASAIHRCFAGIPSSATFVPLCGFLAEKVFGYTPTTESVQNMSDELKAANAKALGNSMMYIICAATVINVVCYGAMFFTYPTDSKKKGEQKQK
ncbi:putative transporter [Babesia divergens]|uniref:Transporter n=1 Tax=Babesia divergens TaxID=32595 RepID=A0AAD9LI08_BABDI|nr:putative transporter [Babesia divergens]